MKIIIEVNNCRECPYFKTDRYFYCGKRFKTCTEAYKAGIYAEYGNEIQWLMRNCPFNKDNK